jgi:hypothetical protein
MPPNRKANAFRTIVVSPSDQPRREVAAPPDLFWPDRRIAARGAGWRNDRHIARLRRWRANFRVNSCGRAEHAVGSRQLVAERLRSRVVGRALRRDSALLRHRLRRRATRRIPCGRWWSCLCRWRRWRRWGLSDCRAGCRQSCQDQKKRFSLHGGGNASALPLFPAGGRNRLADSVYQPSRTRFGGDAVLRRPSNPKSHQRRFLSHGGVKPDLAAFSRISANHEDYLGYLPTCGDHRRWRALCGHRADKQSGLSRCL